MTFTKHFDKYVCDGDSITCEKDGFTITARVERDEDHGPPWKEEDGHGPVSDWRRKEDKRAGEVLLVSDRHSARFYNWQKAIKIAKRDGWGAPPYETAIPESKGEKAVRAVQHDFDILKAWCNDEWWYACLTLSVSKGNIEIDEYAASLCGIAVNCGDDCNGYLLEVANELLDDALAVAKKRAAEMIKELTT